MINQQHNLVAMTNPINDRIWYHLVNEEGEDLNIPYPIRPSSQIQIVADVLEAVWEKWKTTKLMHGLVAEKLSVYADKAAIDNRSPALEMGQTVTALETAEEKPLVIVVPEQKPTTNEDTLLNAVLRQVTETNAKLEDINAKLEVLKPIVAYTVDRAFEFVAESDRTEDKWRGISFRAELIRAYGLPIKPTHIQCSLLGSYLPAGNIIAAHIFPRIWSHSLYLLEIDDVDDLRNGVFLYKPIEHALDAGWITFLFSPSTNQFHCRVLYPGILGEDVEAEG
ncbi:hypothetical protein DFS34DRAFT_640245 [Phlyctochytrium arcticum]|nr:hypothetical protein DFS34DRAFT_640245 [Phlyctochytrium arcticum]